MLGPPQRSVDVCATGYDHTGVHVSNYAKRECDVRATGVAVCAVVAVYLLILYDDFGAHALTDTESAAQVTRYMMSTRTLRGLLLVSLAG